MRFSAAATLVLTGLSLKDKLSEKKHPGLIAKTSNVFISSGYKDALQDIQFWGIDTDAIVKISESQIFIENNSKDIKNSNFNAIAYAWNANNIEMPSQIRREVICYIHELKNKIVDLSEEFQMDKDVKISFLHRLEENISLRLEGEFSDNWINQLKQFEEGKSRSKLQVAILGARKFLSKDEFGEKKILGLEKLATIFDSL